MAAFPVSWLPCAHDALVCEVRRIPHHQGRFTNPVFCVMQGLHALPEAVAMIVSSYAADEFLLWFDAADAHSYSDNHTVVRTRPHISLCLNPLALVRLVEEICVVVLSAWQRSDEGQRLHSGDRVPWFLPLRNH